MGNGIPTLLRISLHKTLTNATGKPSNFMGKKQDRHHLNQEIQVHITLRDTAAVWALTQGTEKGITQPTVLLTETRNLSLTTKMHPTNPN